MDPLVPSNYADDVEPERLQMALERQAAKLRAATDEDVRHSASTTASSTDGIPGSFRVNGPEYSQNMPIDLMDESQDFGSPSPMPPRKPTPPASPEVKAELVDPTDRQKELDRVREDTLEAVRQGAAKAEVVSPERKKRTFICVVAAVTLLNLIIALGVGLGLRRSRVNANHLSRQELVETAVRQETGREFSEEGTSQHEALLWMIHNDTFVEYPLETDEARATFRQRYALCVFAFSTGLEEWKGQEFWLEDVHLCDWSNVACNKDRKITEISLDDIGLKGTLPTELGLLTETINMFLFGNPELTGTLPTELGRMSAMQYFYANQCDLSGSIPPEIGDLTQLSRFYIFDNKLTGTIPTAIRKLHQLQEFGLGQNNITGTIPSEMWHLQKLEVMTVNDNSLEGTIPTEMGSVVNLEHLDLEGNSFSGRIPDTLGNLFKLQTLRVGGNDLSGAMPVSVCELRTEDPTLGLWELEADCLSEIECSCCTQCF